jgi:type VI secretion system protein ImpF
MARGLVRRGGRALLFDRLVRPEPAPGEPPRGPTPAYFGVEDLKRSVAEQLRWLLNTRAPVDYATLEARTAAGLRSTLDYGLPDFSTYGLDDSGTRERLARHIRDTVRGFEPRLVDPQVRVDAIDGRNQRIAVSIGGSLWHNLSIVPVEMLIEIGGEDPADVA